MLTDGRLAYPERCRCSPCRTGAQHFSEDLQLTELQFDTVQATVYGTLAVAAVQGSLGGLMFWILGLPTPLLWGLVMSLLSVVPVLGAFIVWIPAAILLLLMATGPRTRSSRLGAASS
ncbi:AI-2E family transporter [Mesorhizobium sp. INR15]|uniref:AI-2E family transporter n=1 Tax=Mesorhizobium sp. INR15 TaxID=2654248 RepID=UPI0021561C4E|nr:AI-2E family transporter [Mesorhizobium sp. INR15]